MILKLEDIQLKVWERICWFWFSYPSASCYCIRTRLRRSCIFYGLELSSKPTPSGFRLKELNYFESSKLMPSLGSALARRTLRVPEAVVRLLRAAGSIGSNVAMSACPLARVPCPVLSIALWYWSWCWWMRETPELAEFIFSLLLLVTSSGYRLFATA